MELDRVGATGRGRAGDQRLERALQVQPRRAAGAAIAHEPAAAGIADPGTGTADGDAGRPAVDGTGEGSAVVGPNVPSG